MTQVFPTTFPPSNTPIVDEKGAMSNTGMSFFRALFNRTGQGSGLPNQVNINVSGAAGQVLTADWNLITANIGNCILPTLTGGQMVVVQCSNGTGVDIIPPAGATIDGGGPYTLADLKIQIFWFFSSTDIRSTQLG
jgi:hypothetical protein